MKSGNFAINLQIDRIYYRVYLIIKFIMYVIERHDIWRMKETFVQASE